MLANPLLILLRDNHDKSIFKGVILMNNVIAETNEKLTTSILIAKAAGQEHRSVMNLIRKYKNDLEEFGTCGFEVQNSKSGRPLEYACLNEQQVLFLVSLMRNTPTVVDLKFKTVKEFYRMKDALSQASVRQQNVGRKQLREPGKLIGIMQPDIIEEFVQYAKSQGSKSSEKYYTSVADMENKALSFLQQKYKSLKEDLTGKSLMVISAANLIVQHAIKEGMAKGLRYDEIYNLAKNNVEKFAGLINR